MAYATSDDIQARISRTLSAEEKSKCNVLLEDASVIIDSYNINASDDSKKVVSCRMVIRAIGNGGEQDVPVGATQGTMSALGYSQTWTISNGSAGELYLTKTDKQMLGYGSKIGSYSPVEELGAKND